jgi:hypothetical protein
MQFRELFGYHTCWSSIADQCISGSTSLRPGEKAWDWLGTGVYFWIENYRMAQLWSNKLKRDDIERAKKENVSILKCHITLGNCLNLADTRHVERVRAFLSKVEKSGYRFVEYNIVAPRGHPIEGELHKRYLDHKIIDCFIAFIESQSGYSEMIDTVLGVFENGPSVSNGAGIYEYSSIQLAVRNRAVGQIRYVSVNRE